MKRLSLLAAAALALFGCGGTGDSVSNNYGGIRRTVTPGEVDRATRSLTRGKSVRVITGSNAFGFKLFSELTKAGTDSSIFVSPASVAMALSMAFNGAEGQTKAAMAEALGLKDLSLAEVNEGQKQLLTVLSAPDPKVKLEIGNSLWAKAGVEFKREYLGRVEDVFGAKPTVLDFASLDSPKTINAWVEQATQGRIKEIVEKIDPEAAMFLVNAVYFKGDWKDPFEPSKTADKDFTPAKGKAHKVPMMARRDDFAYLAAGKCQIVRLPYGSGRLGMSVLLPNEGVAMKDLLKELDAKNWSEWAGKLVTTKGTVVLPKFRAEYSAGLNPSLKAMGMAAAFSDQADFTGMRQERDLFLKDVLHKTFVEVNEEGTEAAAATKVEVGVTSVPAQPQKEFTFVADRPFLYAIDDKETGLILFIGLMADPAPPPKGADTP